MWGAQIRFRGEELMLEMGLDQHSQAVQERGGRLSHSPWDVECLLQSRQMPSACSPPVRGALLFLQGSLWNSDLPPGISLAELRCPLILFRASPGLLPRRDGIQGAVRSQVWPWPSPECSVGSSLDSPSGPCPEAEGA